MRRLFLDAFLIEQRLKISARPDSKGNVHGAFSHQTLGGIHPQCVALRLPILLYAFCMHVRLDPNSALDSEKKVLIRSDPPGAKVVLQGG